MEQTPGLPHAKHGFQRSNFAEHRKSLSQSGLVVFCRQEYVNESVIFFLLLFLSLFMKKKWKKDNEQGADVHTGYYIRADGSTLAGMTMRSQDWGSATSTPPLVNDGLCDV